MSLQTLERCVNLWGRANLLDGLPQIRPVENALYLPWSHGGPWGLFDAQGSPVRESLNLRTVDGLASGPQPVPSPNMPENIRHVDDTYLYLGLLHVHFGHFLINSFARLWPLVFGRRRLPRLVWHMIGEPGHHARIEFLTSILAGLDTSLDDIDTFSGPVKFRRLLVPETSFHEQFCAYPVFRSLASRVGSAYYRSDEVDTIETPVFLSKALLTTGVGRFEGEQAIEDTLRGAGIDIVHPEALSFPDQVRLFARRRRVLATSGSALHTSIFGPPKRRILSVNPMREINSNFIMIDQLNKNEIEYYYPRDMTYSTGPLFLTRHHAPDPIGIAKDVIKLVAHDIDRCKTKGLLSESDALG